MHLKIDSVKGIHELNGVAFYIQDEYAFNYKPKRLKKSSSLLLIYDTLTIVFEEESRQFYSLDAYTNKDIWKHDRNLSFPQDCPEGILSILEGFEDDHIESFKFVPEFYYNDNVVMIDINNHDSKFYKIGENVIVGLRDHQITSFIFKSVEFR